MTLGQYIIEYRREHNMSQRQFAKQCGMSNTYISMVENGKNPNTGKPITLSIVALKQIADAMGLTISYLAQRIDDIPIDLGPNTSTTDKRIVEMDVLLSQATDKQLDMILQYTRYIMDHTDL